MRLLRVLVPAFLIVGLMASVAMADSVDPTVVIRGRSAGPTPDFAIQSLSSKGGGNSSPIAVTRPDQTFFFTATPTNNTVSFQNQIGQTITSLTLTLFGLTLSGDHLTFSCGDGAGGGLFAECGAASGPLGSTVVSFTGGIGLASAISGSDLNDFSLFHSGGCTNCVGGIYDIVFGGADFTGATLVLGFGSGDVGTAATPEPASGLLLLGGLAGLAAWRKRSKKAQVAA